MSTELDELLIYCREKRRVCPMPQRWQELWDMLPNKTRRGAGWEPSLPLILAAWWDASDQAKQERLELHLLWAADHGVIGKVAEFLRSLPEAEWHHRGE
jgi:hypothetical protein